MRATAEGRREKLKPHIGLNLTSNLKRQNEPAEITERSSIFSVRKNTASSHRRQEGDQHGEALGRDKSRRMQVSHVVVRDASLESSQEHITQHSPIKGASRAHSRDNERAGILRHRNNSAYSSLQQKRSATQNTSFSMDQQMPRYA